MSATNPRRSLLLRCSPPSSPPRLRDTAYLQFTMDVDNSETNSVRNSNTRGVVEGTDHSPLPLMGSYNSSAASSFGSHHSSSNYSSNYNNNTLAFPGTSSFGATSLLGGLHLTTLSNNDANDNDDAVVPARPRRLWSVSDTQVPLYPALWPLPSTNSSSAAVIVATPPSVIAIRIAECLRRRSVAVDYDDDAAEATCVTADRCHFTIYLWRRRQQQDHQQQQRSNVIPTSGNNSINGGSNTAITVECVRRSGNPLTYHRTVQAVLAAAQGLDSGADARTPYQAGPTEYPRLLQRSVDDAADTTATSIAPPAGLSSDSSVPVLPSSFYSGGSGIIIMSGAARSEKQPSVAALLKPEAAAHNNNNTPSLPSSSAAAASSTAAAAAAVEALEHALISLSKDRWEAQLFGMQSLVALTDHPASANRAVAVQASMAVLGGGSNNNNNNPLLRQIHTDWMLGLLVDRQLPSEKKRVGVAVVQLSAAANAAAATAAATAVAPNSNASLSSGASSNILGAAADGGKEAAAAMTLDEPNSATALHCSTTTTNNINNTTIDALEDQHASQMRALALRAFTNALSVLASAEDDSEHPAATAATAAAGTTLRSLLSVESPATVSGPVLAALREDLQGASRPLAATVASPYRLATPHEAALAAKCLGLLAQHSDLAMRTMRNDPALLLQLEKAAAVGRSTHAVLAAEARRTYHLLTEEDRSC